MHNDHCCYSFGLSIFFITIIVPSPGFVTDGEFSSLRTMGNSRPISIIQLISDARAVARSTPSRCIESYLILGRNGELSLLSYHRLIVHVRS